MGMENNRTKDAKQMASFLIWRRYDEQTNAPLQSPWL